MTAPDEITTPVDLSWLVVECDECAKSFPGVTALEAHTLATHGHTLGDTAP